MKTTSRIIACALALAPMAAVPDGTNGVDVVVETLFSDGSTNTWTRPELVAALQLVNRKYHRDCETPKGRREWHGGLKLQTVATNGTTLVKTETHEDGQTFTFTAPYVPPSVAVSNANARLKTTLTKGVPKALAAARLRRLQEQQTTNTVSVTVTAGQEAR